MPDTPAPPRPFDDYLYSLALQACIYGWPLFEMQRMRSATSARKASGQGFAGDSPESTQRWCNLFTHERQLLTAGKSRVVMPNNDTLYTNAWLDLSDGPLVMTLPDTGTRYYVLGFLDYFTNPFAHVGTRTTGNGAGEVLVTGPAWSGDVPDRFREPGRHVRAPTNRVWEIGRILVDGPDDVESVNALQDQFRIDTLDDWRARRASQARRFDARFDPRAPFDALGFVGMVNDALAACAPPDADRTLVAQFREVGIGLSPLPPLSAAAQDAMERACATTRALLEGGENALFERSSGADAAVHRPAWRQPAFLGDSFGPQLLRRAFVARQGIGQLSTHEAAYQRCETDSEGERLSGSRRYTLHFAPGQLPPVNAFWSITMYSSKDWFLVPNALERYAIGDRTAGLVRDADGGLTLSVQHAPPLDATARANWLPAPEDAFFLCLRAYLPQVALVDGSYQMPEPQAVRA